MDNTANADIEAADQDQLDLIEDQQQFLPGYPTFDGFSQSLFESLIKATKLANELPDASEHSYYSATFRPFKQKMEQVRDYLVVCMSHLCCY